MTPEDEARAAWLADLPEWQRRFLDASQRGERPVLHPPRRTGKRAATILWGTYMELDLKKWDVIGPDAPAIRRAARERAAWVTTLSQSPHPPDTTH